MIYDCFNFFNELEILDIRLNTLYDVVDKFVLVESNKTFSGNEKEYIFENNTKHFKFFLDKKKNVFCEKPLTTKYATAQKLYKIARKNNLKIVEDACMGIGAKIKNKNPRVPIPIIDILVL